ncbi:VOC family protein [Amnibacterium flavum]|uniref:Bleomycin resistance protein n=1 Tax=Amnibacterium flavum TaxID=2173173 RepID=A0A2V1HUP5_9MICO|nr:VOC family protein [Amnibacterium flavum]PVZ94759.1 bleomycin resistance protein [Amnibacterium flavum]
MTIDVTPHLNFRGDARRALEFYQAAFGGDLVVMTYADMGGAARPEEADQVVWGQVAAPSGFRVMAYDVPSSRAWSRGDDPFFVSVRGAAGDEDALTASWEKLAEGGAVIQPLGPSAWSPLYGMLADRFGVTWVVDIAAEYPAA